MACTTVIVEYHAASGPRDQLLSHIYNLEIRPNSINFNPVWMNN